MRPVRLKTPTPRWRDKFSIIEPLGSLKTKKKTDKHRGSYMIAYCIEFIKQVGEKGLNVRLAEHFTSNSQQV